MVIKIDSENMLKEFGLTEYEIKAYVSLLKLGIATADQISSLGDIPLPRVYDTLTELQKKGFVLINKGRPKKFKPLPPSKALKGLVEIKKKNFENKIGKLKKNIEPIVKELDFVNKYDSNDQKNYDIWSTKIRGNLQKILEEKENEANDEIIIFSGDMSWLPERFENIKKSLKRNVKIRILMDKLQDSKNVKSYFKKIKSLGASIKSGYKGMLRGEIIDDKVALIAVKMPEGFKKTDYELTIFNNPAMVSTFKENFNFWWNKLKS